MGYKNNVVLFSFITFFFLSFTTLAQRQEKRATFILKGTVTYEEKPMEGVLFELTKNNEEIIKLNSSKSGKFNIKMLQNTVDTNNNYILSISKIGFVTKILNINTYIPLGDYDDNSFVYTLDVELLATSVTNFVIQRPFGKIKWDPIKQLYGIDEIYYRTIYKEEQLLKSNPDKYLLEMLTKQNQTKTLKLNEENKQINTLAKKEKEGDKLAIIKKDSILVAKQDISKELKKEPIKEPVKEIVAKKSVKEPVDSGIIKVAPVNGSLVSKTSKLESAIKRFNSDQDFFDVDLMRAMKIQRNKTESLKIKMNNKRAENISNKYETSNILTSLIDVVDTYEKKTTK
ncbi:MAG: hypothetical protein ABI315_14175 [Bacteroidia bacterium]